VQAAALLKLPGFILRLGKPGPYIRSVAGVCRTLYRNRFLLIDMAMRDIKDQYLGKGLGVLWAVIQPVFLIAVYIFAFVYVFKIRLSTAGEIPIPAGDMTLYIVSGIVPFFAVQNALMRSSGILIQNSNLVKQVVFPVEVLPAKVLSSTLLTQIICTGLLIIYILIRFHSLSPLIILLPVVLVLQYAILLGCSYLLSIITPFFKDLSELISMVCTVLMYATPIFYSVEMLPEVIRPYMNLNPMAHLLYCYRDILCYNEITHPWSWVVLVCLSAFLLGLGTRLFGKTKMLLGNVL